MTSFYTSRKFFAWLEVFCCSSHLAENVVAPAAAAAAAAAADDNETQVT